MTGTILTVEAVDGTTRRVVAGLGPKIAWEAHARKLGLPMTPRVDHAGTDRATVHLDTFPIETYHAYLAWHAETGGADGPQGFTAWCGYVDSVTPGGAPPDPTPAAPTAASSPISQSPPTPTPTSGRTPMRTR